MSDDRVLPIGGKAKGRCPLCSKPSDERYRPFCSKRCADVDRHRWFSESYRFETEETPETDIRPLGEDDERSN